MAITEIRIFDPIATPGWKVKKNKNLSARGGLCQESRTQVFEHGGKGGETLNKGRNELWVPFLERTHLN